MSTNFKSLSSVLQYLLNNDVDAVYYTAGTKRRVVVKTEYTNFFIKLVAYDEDSYNVLFVRGNYADVVSYIKNNTKYENKHTTNGEFPMTKEMVEDIMVYNFIE